MKISKKMFRGITKGFTLVELLIVMGLLGVIAVIVIAAINPIEQANRARDTKFKADSGQIISAIDRYFVSQTEFPWVTSGFSSNSSSSFGFVTAGNEGVGICGANCSINGLLISNNEFKTEFRNRDFVEDSGGGDSSKEIFIGKEAGASGSIYACYIPLSKSARQKAVAEGDVYTLSATDGSRSATTVCDADSADWIASQCMVCIPE